MSDAKPKFDVAISFLVKDEPIAAALYRDLSQSLNVFFFPRKQEEHAGTDGMETMRRTFLEDSRVTVVLHREGWGNTRWTAVEEAAIKEACFNGAWGRLFFVALDRTSARPKWLPEYHVRYNWEDFGLDQAVGAIKARVLESGGQPTSPTPLKRAELLQADERYRMDKALMSSQGGIATILESLKSVFSDIKKQCDEVNIQGHLRIRCEIDFRERNTHQSCSMTDGNVSLSVTWEQEYSNVLDNSGLFVREWDRGFIPMSEMGRRVHIRPPQVIMETKYDPELSRAREYGWKQHHESEEFISSSELAKKCVVQFIELADRFLSGKLRHEEWL